MRRLLIFVLPILLLDVAGRPSNVYLPVVARSSQSTWIVALEQGAEATAIPWPNGVQLLDYPRLARYLNAYVVKYTGDLPPALLENSAVRYVEPVARYYAIGDGTPVVAGNLWHHRQMHVNEAQQIATGQGVTVAVLDTGIQPQYFRDGQIVACESFVPRSTCEDGHGHGTHVAGSVASVDYGIAPDAGLMAGKVLSDQGSGDSSWIASGVLWAADQGADIISMSLGGPDYSRTLCDAVQSAVNDGVVVNVASGNEHKSNPSWPARCPAAIAVGATDMQDSIAGFSNSFRGKDPWWAVVAPGVNIDSVNGSGWSGTSMATPQVSGVVALWCQVAPERCNAADALQRLAETSIDLGTSGFDLVYGWGRIDALAMIQDQEPGPTPTPALPTPTTPRPPTPTTEPIACREAPEGSGLLWCDIPDWLWPYFTGYIGRLHAISACEDLGAGRYNYCPMRYDRWRFVVEMSGYSAWGGPADNKGRRPEVVIEP